MPTKSLTFSKPQNIFLVFGAFFGLILVFLNPPLQSPDEQAHLYRAWEISQGTLSSNEKCEHYLPSNIEKFFNESGLLRIRDGGEKYNFKSSYKKLNDINVSSNLSKYTGTSCPYSLVPYIPYLPAIWIGKILDASIINIFYIGRLSSLIIYLLIIYNAIKLAPDFKKLFLFLGLIPVSMVQAASFSADGIVIGLGFLFISLILNFSFGKETPKIKKVHIVILSLLSALLALSKLPYFVLSLLSLIIPPNKFFSKRSYLMSTLSIVGSSIFAGSLWYFATKNIQVWILSTHEQFQNQLNFIRGNPIKYFEIFLQSTFVENFFDNFREFFGVIGWMSVFLPFSFILFYFAILNFFAFKESQNFIKKISTDKRTYWRTISVLTLTILLIIFIISTISYLVWTAKDGVGEYKITGVQGRYYLPFSPLLFILPTLLLAKIKEKEKFLVVATILGSIAVTLSFVYSRYY